MTMISRREADLYCDGCGIHLLLSPDEVTGPDLRRMAREEGWVLRRLPMRFPATARMLDLCAECAALPA